MLYSIEEEQAERHYARVGRRTSAPIAGVALSLLVILAIVGFVVSSCGERAEAGDPPASTMRLASQEPMLDATSVATVAGFGDGMYTAGPYVLPKTARIGNAQGPEIDVARVAALVGEVHRLAARVHRLERLHVRLYWERRIEGIEDEATRRYGARLPYIPSTTYEPPGADEIRKWSKAAKAKLGKEPAFPEPWGGGK